MERNISWRYADTCIFHLHLLHSDLEFVGKINYLGININAAKNVNVLVLCEHLKVIF